MEPHCSLPCSQEPDASFLHLTRWQQSTPTRSVFQVRFTHSMPFPCRAHAVPLPCRAAKGLECLFHLIYTVRTCLIHTCHAMPMPCSDHAVLLKTTAQHGRRETAVLCCGRGTAWARHAMCESAFNNPFKTTFLRLPSSRWHSSVPTYYNYAIIKISLVCFQDWVSSAAKS